MQKKMEAKTVEGNPWLSIWVRPRETMRNILDTNFKYGFWVLCAFNGFSWAMSSAQSNSLAAMLPAWAILILSLILSPLLGYIAISISGGILTLTGKWVGGKGRFQQVRSAVAWSSITNAVVSLTWLILLGLFGGQIFCSAFTKTNFVGYMSGIVFLIFLVQSIAAIWGFILLLKTVGEAHGFSAWRALLSVIIPTVIVIAIGWIVSWAIWGTNAFVK